MTMKPACVLLVLLLSSSVSFAKGERVLTFAHDVTWPPMEFIDEKQRIVGFDVDLTDALAAEMGARAVHVVSEWTPILKDLQGKKYDAVASSVSITPERMEIVDMTDSYLTVNNALLVMKDTKISSPEELGSWTGRKIGVQISTLPQFYLEEHYPGVEVKTYDDITDAIADLFGRQLDGVMGDDYVIRYFVKSSPVFSNRFRIAFAFPQGALGIAVRKGNAALRDEMNAALKSLKNKGALKKLEKKWLGEEESP